MALQPKSGLGLLCIEVSKSHTIRHTVGLLWTSDQPAADNTTYKHNKQTNIHALSGIRTRDPSNQAAADLTLDRTATEIDQYGICPMEIIIHFATLNCTSRHVSLKKYFNTGNLI
jgi:hypothetical protein